MFFNYLLAQLDRLLSLLPFNGNKLKLGGLATLISLLHLFFPAFNILIWADAEMLKLGLSTAFIGAIHKAIKELLAQVEPQLLTNSSAKAVAVADKSNLKAGG